MKIKENESVAWIGGFNEQLRPWRLQAEVERLLLPGLLSFLHLLLCLDFSNGPKQTGTVQGARMLAAWLLTASRLLKKRSTRLLLIAEGRLALCLRIPD